jgi:hypothetical protein
MITGFPATGTVVVALGLRLRHPHAEVISAAAYAFRAPGTTLLSNSTLFRGTTGRAQVGSVICVTTGGAVTVLYHGQSTVLLLRRLLALYA